jgi:hypothetical protein
MQSCGLENFSEIAGFGADRIDGDLPGIANRRVDVRHLSKHNVAVFAISLYTYIRRRMAYFESVRFRIERARHIVNLRETLHRLSNIYVKKNL